MTHGEDAGPETHQDSAVLTYLEGLLMHPVATGPGATATRRSDADRNGDEERRNHVAAAAAQGPTLANHGPAVREKASPPGGGASQHLKKASPPGGGASQHLKKASPPGGGASQHLKKARLLRSGAWQEAEDNWRKAPSSASLNGHLGGGQQQQRSGQDGPPLGESTLLASLLTTFSSRLQGVAMAQQPEAQNGGGKSPDASRHDAFEAYGTASNRLKGLVRKSKSQSHESYDSRRASQERLSESPRSNVSAAAQLSPSNSAVSCAERLKAVANLVKTRSSPAPSPRPSMACSQLALLLSSEAHLKQYSREQVLKAQLAGQSASERLAAIASQKSSQDRKPASIGETRMVSEAESSMNSQSRTSPLASASSTKGSPAPSLALSSSSSNSSVVSPHASSQPQRDRSSSRPPQNCSSLLLLLLNNHNSHKQLTRSGHLEEQQEEREEERIPPSRTPSLLLDHRIQSDQYRSPTKSSSDVESYYSSCSPIDLSMHTRAPSHEPAPPCTSSSSSSPSCPLDKLTETLLNRWKPDTPGPKVSAAGERDVSPDTQSHHKVTLMQLLLGRQNNEKVNKTLNILPTDPLKLIGSTYEESLRQSPADCRIGVGRAMTRSSLNEDASGSQSPYAFSSPQVQSSPLDLCKANNSSSEKATGFSASKLLQNLAQCGLTNSSPSPPPLIRRPTKLPSPSLVPTKRPSPSLVPSKPSALLECLSPPPAQRNGSPVVEPPPRCSFTPHRRESPASPAASQIESLLERRTVLQLLLGSASHAEQPSGRRSTEDQPSFRSPDVRDGLHGPSMDIKIKTEPKEDSPFPNPFHSDTGLQHWAHGRHERHRPLFEHQGDFKSEPCPDDIVSKYGLLSQLLKQQTSTYNPGAPSDYDPRALTSTYNPGTPADYDPRALKQEQQDHRGGPSPKRRRLCMELAEQLTSELSSGPVDSYVGLGGKLLLSPEQEESPARSPVSKVLPRDHQGFNVLKQLLLSDNCLKGLSQGSGLSSPSETHTKVNGSLPPHQLHFNHKLSQLPWQRASPSPRSAGSAAHWPTNGSNGFHESPRNNAAAQTTTTLTRTTTTTRSPGSVKQECQSPAGERQAEGREEGCGSGPDSPRLTRANPILYYMLQRGKGQVRRASGDQGQVMAHCEINIKEEPATDEDPSQYDHRLSSLQ
ncbi:nuclear receptor-interacting protein 1 isoform X2 [Alosa sapidissima]|uniref:nuclear receptor-interacting protein 1 isoform X2 n=1 Tax=Alosa sapidissima TaxID=34773 RepID=UPI001C0A0CC8|nr:nuclear receptor-interacting protein 1 isoform X2 [Alosa sapidissima]